MHEWLNGRDGPLQLDNFIARVNLEINNNRCGENVDIIACLGADFFMEGVCSQCCSLAG